MKLKNTELLINSYRLTVICVKDDDNIMLNKLLSGLNENGYASMPLYDTQTIDVLQKDIFARYSRKANEFIEFAEQNNAHLIATVSVDKYSYWRHIYFKVAETYKNKVCFVRFAQCENGADIHLQIESGENAWQYIPYCLDEKGNLCETN